MGLVRRVTLDRGAMESTCYIPVIAFVIVVGSIVVYNAIQSWKDDFDEETKDLWQGYYDELEGKEKK